MLFSGVSSRPQAAHCQPYPPLQLSLVVVPKFSFVEFLKSIVRHRISHLMYVVMRSHLTNQHLFQDRLVPPQVVLLCKVSFTRHVPGAELTKKLLAPCGQGFRPFTRPIPHLRRSPSVCRAHSTSHQSSPKCADRTRLRLVDKQHGLYLIE